MAGSVELGREAFARAAWADAHAHLSASELAGPDDHELYAVASYMSGHDDDSAAAWERAHTLALGADDVEQAARCGAWLAIALLLKGEHAHASGWLARVERVLANTDADVPARGILLVPAFLGALDGGDLTAADAMATEMVAIGSRLDDADVLAFGLLCHGEVLAAAGDVAGGMRRLDEAMVSVTAGETGPITSGIIYCAVIEACMAVSDMRRAGEWTAALTAWCASQPGLVPYRGQCLVHRSEILLARGTWTEALAEATRARDRLSDPVHPALGDAYYQQGELHRLLGSYDEAEQAYRAAAAHGREPAPGFALLRLAAGDVGAARAAITRVAAESGGVIPR
ncbi:MAG TPA: hypothetical protein VFX21_02425, partial [Acidimicrobiia bacterium]|nr:hypothetical protein [Acidimicrobiia bacterium]